MQTCEKGRWLGPRTGERPKCNEDEAFIEVVTLLMSVASYHEKRQVRWDPAAEVIV